MILTAHQPVYLPWLGLFHKIALCDIFCIFDGAQYLKKDWNNRNKIITAAGEQWLTVPVLTAGHREKPIREIEINNTVNWRDKHWKSLLYNYKKAPFFSKYSDFFEDLYKREWSNLVTLNDCILFYLLNTLGIKPKSCRASDLHFEGTKSDLVLDMCKKLGADVYIFGALGRDYAEVEKFEKDGISVQFQDYIHPVYPQLYADFISNLSVVDLLFNCGDKSYEILMAGNLSKEDVIRISNKERV